MWILHVVDHLYAYFSNAKPYTNVTIEGVKNSYKLDETINYQIDVQGYGSGCPALIITLVRNGESIDFGPRYITDQWFTIVKEYSIHP